MRNLVVMATIGWLLVSFLCFERIYADTDAKKKEALKETWIGDPPPIVSNAGNSGVKTTTIDTPDTIIGALKAVHELQISISGHSYTAKTPFWVNRDNATEHVVFDARRQKDGKLVRVYAFSSPALVIEEDITREPK